MRERYINIDIIKNLFGFGEERFEQYSDEELEIYANNQIDEHDRLCDEDDYIKYF